MIVPVLSDSHLTKEWLKKKTRQVRPTWNFSFSWCFNVCHKDWLTYSTRTDRPCELSYNFSISSDLTQIVNFPTQIPEFDTHSLAILDLFICYNASICSTMTIPPLGNSHHVVVSVSSQWLFNRLKTRCPVSLYSSWLQKSYGITELQDFQQLVDAIFYTEVLNAKVALKMFFQLKIALPVLGKLKFYIFTFCRLQAVPNKQVFKNQTFFLPWQCPSMTTSQSLMKLYESPFFIIFFFEIIPNLSTMILLCIETSLTLVTETFSIELEMEVTLLIPSMIEQVKFL